jgi:SRSO17 transposase
LEFRTIVAVDERDARALLRRFGQFADQFGDCFNRRAQCDAATQYLDGLFNDSERKSMQAMHGRLSDPITYDALQHFITHSPWSADRVWSRLRDLVPVRTGLLAIDETSFPKQGRHSVAVKRQYCGAEGKIANCQVAVSSVLLTDRLTWPLTFELYVPKEWIEDADRRAEVGLPDTVRFREKWRIALAHVRRVLKAGFTLTAVLADADYGRVARFRRGLEKLGLPYAVAIPWSLSMWTSGERRTRTAGDLAAQIPEREWERVCWGRGTKGDLAARFVARRVRLAKGRGERWLLCERTLIDDERKYYLLNLPPAASLDDLVRLARSRWPIEQQYRELKDELGFDHFEGRKYQGWNHHVVLSAVAFTFLQIERRRAPDEPRPTLPTIRCWVREIMSVLYVIGNRKLLHLLVSFQRNPPLRR